jgi:hypothetical protein
MERRNFMPDRQIRIFIFTGILSGLAGSGYVAFSALKDNEFFWGALGAFYFAGVLLCGWWLWNRRLWALKLSWLMALLALAFGSYIAYFRWTFWLFETPTLWDRMKAVLHPMVLFFVGCPILWLLYFTRSGIRKSFTNVESHG